MVQPLPKLIPLKKYKGSGKLIWTPEAIAAFEFCQVAISNCQELYFLKDTATPILQTDASDYGIGGYVIMVTNEKVRVFGRKNATASSTEFDSSRTYWITDRSSARPTTRT